MKILYRINKITLLLLASILAISAANGQSIFKINQYNTYTNGALMPVMTLFTNHQFSKKLSLTSYFYVSAYPKNSWGQGLVGISYTPVKGVTIGFLAGFQTNETEIWRISPIIILNKNRFSFSGAFEFGGKRFRWDAMGFYSVKSFKFGAEFIRYYSMYATGPRVEFSFLKKQPITVFFTPLWDWTYGTYASMFGIFSTFGAFKKIVPLDD